MKWPIFLVFITLFSSIYANECRQLFVKFNSIQKSAEIKEATSKMDLKLYGIKNTPQGRREFEKIYAECMSPNSTLLKDRADEKVNTVFSRISYATMIGGYTYSNWEKPKDLMWFFNLGFGMGFSAVASKIQAALVLDHGHRYHYLVKDYLFGRGTDLTYMGITFFFPNKEKSEIQMKLDELKKSDQFTEDMIELKKYIDNPNHIERVKKELFNALSHMDYIDLGLGKHGDIDFNHLTPKDLEDKSVQKVVLAAIIAEEYERKKALLQTGSITTDSFIFDSFYAALKVPKDIYLQKISTQVMCLNMFNPSRGVKQVIAINVVNQVLFADYFGVAYKILKNEINGSDENTVERASRRQK